MAEPNIGDIYTRLSSAPVYTPANVSTFFDPSIEAGDVVAIKQGNNAYSVPVYTQTVNWSGQTKSTVEATGKRKRDGIAKQQSNAYGGGGGGVRNANGDIRAILDVDDVSGSITAIAGLFERDANGVLHIVNGGGMMVDATDEHGIIVSSGIYTEGNLTAGIMISKINGGGSSVTISADKVDLIGYVTVSELDTVNARIRNLMSGQTSAISLLTRYLSVSTDVILQGTHMNKHTLTINGRRVSFLSSGDISDGSM